MNPQLFHITTQLISLYEKFKLKTFNFNVLVTYFSMAFSTDLYLLDKNDNKIGC